MAKVIYGLCALTAASCAFLLLRSYLQTRFRLLLWSGACFCGLTVNNLLLVLDRLYFIGTDLSTWRLAVALASVLLLLLGLILESNA